MILKNNPAANQINNNKASEVMILKNQELYQKSIIKLQNYEQTFYFCSLIEKYFISI